MPTVLVVDDDEHQRLLYQEELEFEGYEVILAASGQEAIDTIANQSVDCVVLDIAMSTVAGGKVMSSRDRGLPLPEGWLTDGEGLPTTDPNVFTAGGALTPFAGHKGYGIALLVESLAGVLAGAGMTSDILSWPRDSSRRCNEGHSFIAIDIGAMMPPDQFHERMDELISRMKNAPKAKGADRTYVPGEMEWECEQVAQKHGVPLTQITLHNLKGLGIDTGVDLGFGG